MPPSQRKKRHRKPARSRGPSTLLVLDQTPFLKKATARCRRIQRSLDKSRRDLEQFETVAKPAFQQWMARAFGPTLSALRELQSTLDEKIALLEVLRFAVWSKGVPEYDVWEYVQRHRNDPSYRHPVYDADEDEFDDVVDFDEDDFSDFTGDEEDGDEPCAEEMAKLFGEAAREVFGEDFSDEMQEEMEEGFASFFGLARRQAISKPDGGAAELKVLYRTLARRLHPDLNPTADDRAPDRWHEVTEAYGKGDVDALRALEAVCEADAAGLGPALGLARLNAWADYHQGLLQPLKSRLREARRHPAWIGFIKNRQPPASLRDEIEEDLQHGLHGGEMQLDEIEMELDYFRSQSKPKPRPRRSRAPRRRRKQAAARDPANANPAPARAQRTVDPFQTEFAF
ncbi:MAG: hypothetical protein EA425_05940 [Puniceicoccaceae bacterium]|nr:MAG: hypothetical protein EA425_05940 [Puniceicoccaceae bacterium]